MEYSLYRLPEDAPPPLWVRLGRGKLSAYLTLGCVQGTVFGDLMEKFEEVRLPDPTALN